MPGKSAFDCDRRNLLIAAGITPLMLSPLSPAAEAASTAARADVAMDVQKLAWAGIRLSIGNTTLFIDATKPDPEGGTPGPELQSVTDRTFALATHPHGDHCDPKALEPVLGDRGYLVVSEDALRFIDNRIVPVETARLYEPVFFSRQSADFVAWAVPAVDGLGSPQVSWVVDAGGKRIIHCGDTMWHGSWWNIARAYGPFDAAFLPINGFRQTGGIFTHVTNPMALTPEQAADAAKILNARQVIPIHFGSSGNPSYVEAANALGRFLSAARRLDIETRVLAPGERMAI